MTENEAYVVLNAIPGLGNMRIRRLVSHFGSARRVLSLKERDLFHSGIFPSRWVESFIQFPKYEFLQKEFDLCHQSKAKVISESDPDYPVQLKAIDDAPVILYVKGKLFPEEVALAIVGSRRASFYGLTVADELAGQLSELGCTIVSGMARGIDTAAHRGTLKVKGRTMAVLGCGLNNIYPKENKKLMQQIAEEGAVISEFPMETLPHAYNFPRRNRLVSGLCLGVIVVEASQRSGALITSRFALEQGREVFAVPGRIGQVNSQGTHQLIKQGAKLINSITDIIEELEPRIKMGRRDPDRIDNGNVSTCSKGDLTSLEQEVLGCLSKAPIYVDEVLSRLGYSFGKLSEILTRLQFKQLIKQLPGQYFVRSV